MKKILVLDGGGAKGVIQSRILCDIEQKVGKQCCDIFDLIAGTSVGSILGSILSSGKMSAEDMHNMMLKTLPIMFKKRWFKWPKYSRKELINVFCEYIGTDFLMKDCKTKYMSTSVNMVSGLTHYFKSWEEKDGNEKLLDIVNRSYAAPLYFGSIVDDIHKAVWLDGGVGNENCPILETVIEAVRQQWLGIENIHILSLGTGWSNYKLTFEKAKKARTMKQLFFFMDPSDGGLARNQSIVSRVSNVEALANIIDNFTFQRIDQEIDKKMDKLDGIKYVNEYEEVGKKLMIQINIDLLK